MTHCMVSRCILGCLIVVSLTLPRKAMAFDTNGAALQFGFMTQLRGILEDPIRVVQFELWLSGYLTALNRLTPNTYAFVDRVSTASQWIRSYCIRNPHDSIPQALLAFEDITWPTRIVNAPATVPPPTLDMPRRPEKRSR